MNSYAFVVWFACWAAGVSGAPFAGRWEGQFQFRWPDGRVGSDPLVIVLRQFGEVVEGSWGANRDIQNRFKKASNVAFVENLRALHRALLDVGYESHDTALDIEPAGHHNEATWSARFPRMVRFLFPAANARSARKNISELRIRSSRVLTS